MGGGGYYYSRDVTDRSRVTSQGFSDVAEKKMSRIRVDEAVLPRGRKLVCEAASPIVLAFDVTGSMGNLPKIIYDKTPMVAGQLAEQNYLEDVMISLAAVGDVLSDSAPLQVCDFSKVKNLDEWLQRIWLEGNGGGQAKESYELIAYFYARMCDMPKAQNPVFIFTGDEGFRESLPAATLSKHFGSGGEDTFAKIIFEELKKKFKNNVFLIHRRYGGGCEEDIVQQWQNALGKERVIILNSDSSIADVTLGILAIVSGKRTREEYLQDMRTRGQTRDRIAEVEESLMVLPVMPKRAESKKPAKNPTGDKKPGRI